MLLYALLLFLVGYMAFRLYEKFAKTKVDITISDEHLLKAVKNGLFDLHLSKKGNKAVLDYVNSQKSID